MIIPGITVVIPRKTQVIPGITQRNRGFCYRNKGFCYRNSSTGRGRRKTASCTGLHIAAEYPVEKNPFIQKTRSTRQRGERSDPPGAYQPETGRAPTPKQKPHKTQIFLKMKLLEISPLLYELHLQRNTVQGNNYLHLLQSCMGCSTAVNADFL